jgi:glycosyltransferase involved in cell wall biosynthesis
MRIGIFTELYPPHIGGQEVRYFELATAMLQLGHTVDVFCVRHSTEIPEHEVNAGVSISRFPLAKNYKIPLLKPLRRALVPMLRYSAWVRAIARPENYDLMLFNQWPLLHVLFTSKKSRDKMVLDWCEVRNQRVYYAFMRYLPRFSNRNIAVSQAVADSVSLASSIEVEYIPSGVWVSKYQNRTKEHRSGLAYVGRVMEHKNLTLLREAYELLKEEGYSGDLTIVGDGPALDALIRRGKASRFSNSIRFLGFVDEKLKVDLLSRAEILVVTSRREGFPRVVAEAMASGLPVVTAEFPDNGTKTVVRAYDIGLVAEPTAQALSVAIRDVLHDWSRYSDQCRKHSIELDWSIVVNKLLAPRPANRVGRKIHTKYHAEG